MDTQPTFLRMIYRGIFDNYPDLKIILGHNAEGLGIYFDRIDSVYRQGDVQPNADFGHINHEPSYCMTCNLIADTSGSFSRSTRLHKDRLWQSVGGAGCRLAV